MLTRSFPALPVLLVLAGCAVNDAEPDTAVSDNRLASIGHTPDVVVNNSFVSPLTETFGDVVIGQQAFVASNAVLWAEPGARICVGHETYLEDNATIVATGADAAPPSTCGDSASSTQERVGVAHQASVRNSQIGNAAFIGIHARLDNVVLEDGAYVLHGAEVSNVRIGRDRLVPVGAVIRDQAEADALPLKTDAEAEFQSEMLAVKRELAQRYPELYQSGGYAAVTGVAMAPSTSFNLEPAEPVLGRNVRLRELASVVGDVQLGDQGVVGRRTVIRADEGAPIVVGQSARIEDRVSLHALQNAGITIGRNLRAGDNAVLQGPLEIGDGLRIGDDAVLMRARVGNDVVIGDRAIVIGVTVPDAVRVPTGELITSQAQIDALVSQPSE